MTDVFVPEHLSHSSVDSYARCSWAYKLQRVDKVKQSASWATVAGSAVHAATENLDLKDFGIDTGGPLTFADALDAALIEQKDRYGVEEKDLKATGRPSKDWPNKRNKDYWLATGQGHVDRWRAFLMSGYDIAIVNNEPAVELEIKIPIGDTEFLMYIDRILTNPRFGPGIVDLKSGASAPDSNTQLHRYGLARYVLESDQLIRWGAYYMTQEQGGLTEPADLDSVPKAKTELPILAALRGIRAEAFVPNIGRHCSSCFVRDACAYGGTA